MSRQLTDSPLALPISKQQTVKNHGHMAASLAQVNKSVFICIFVSLRVTLSDNACCSPLEVCATRVRVMLVRVLLVLFMTIVCSEFPTYGTDSAHWAVAEWTVAQWVVAQWTVAQWVVAQWTVAEWTVAEWTVAEWTVVLTRVPL